MSRDGREEWFDRAGARTGRGDAEAGDVGLRFECTQCGHCCTGAEGYVNFTDEEAEAMAHELGVSFDEFLRLYTHDTPEGRSLTERPTEHGFDCVFLDRESSPGRALCRVYRCRPTQCRTWPFWASNLTSEHAWRRAAIECPGIDRGQQVIPPE